jgi:hypothetical protein
VELTRAGAEKKLPAPITPAFELIDTAKFRASMPSFDRRMMWMMAILGFSGCDYCEGTNRFGYTEGPLVKLLPYISSTPKFIQSVWWRDDPYRKGLWFYPEDYLLWLRHVPFKKKPILDLAEFNKEVHDILWIIQYSYGFDSQRHTAGPPPPDYSINLFPGATTFEEAVYDSTLEHPRVLFYEEYVNTTPSFPYGYCPAQTAALFGDLPPTPINPIALTENDISTDEEDGLQI